MMCTINLQLETTGLKIMVDMYIVYILTTKTRMSILSTSIAKSKWISAAEDTVLIKCFFKI